MLFGSYDTTGWLMSQIKFGPYTECSLALIVDLVNTLDPSRGVDDLPDPAAFDVFLRKRDLSYFAEPTAADLEEVTRLRGALRRVFEAEVQAEASAILNDLLEQSGARPVLTDHDGVWHMHYLPKREGLVRRITAEASMALASIIAAGDFERLRGCAGERCVDVFIDESRNRSRRFCSPEICGNRASVKAFRARRRASTSRAERS